MAAFEVTIEDEFRMDLDIRNPAEMNNP